VIELFQVLTGSHPPQITPSDVINKSGIADVEGHSIVILPPLPDKWNLLGSRDCLCSKFHLNSRWNNPSKHPPLLFSTPTGNELVIMHTFSDTTSFRIAPFNTLDVTPLSLR
jgi:hypothetical protein